MVITHLTFANEIYIDVQIHMDSRTNMCRNRPKNLYRLQRWVTSALSQTRSRLMNNSIWMTIPNGKINGKYDNIKIMPTHQQNNNQPRHARKRGNKAYNNWKLGQNLSGYKDICKGMGSCRDKICT